MSSQPEPGEELLSRIEARAVEMARGAGDLLGRRFGSPMAVEYKDKKRTDPVTTADRDAQEYLVRQIAQSFPQHGIVSEEQVEGGEGPALDFTWVLDPLDGTKNFLSGLPLYACSIGLLYRGVPVAGAIFVPWPGGSGLVLHAHKGGGAFADGRRLAHLGQEEPMANRLAAHPGVGPHGWRFGRGALGKAGEVRSTGSIAFELALTAMGVLQYTFTTRPMLWDVAAGALLVQEAGGQAVVATRRRRLGMVEDVEWRPLEGFVAEWGSEKATNKALREWSRPMLFGSKGVVEHLARGVRPQRSMTWRPARRPR